MMLHPSNRKDKNEDMAPTSRFDNLETTQVMRAARIFNNTQINASECVEVITNILYMLGQGIEFSKEESTQIFFSVTKLFQSKNHHLRRMVYLVIKELKIPTDEALIVVSCLNRDMTSDNKVYRANAIRVLAKVMDATLVGTIERFFKQAIVDEDPFVATSTLVASQFLMSHSSDIVKRWNSEIQVALSKPRMVGFHALSLFYRLKGADRLAMSKVVSALIKSNNGGTGMLALCMQIRLVTNLLIQDQGRNPDLNQLLLKFLHDQLHSKKVEVMYEAARALASIPHLSSAEIQPATHVLQECLISYVPAQRLAAVRTLAQLVTRHPLLVTSCSVDIEGLIQDPNRSIATLAITTLLKTGVEANVDRLMKSISGFMTEISDEFKIVLVDAIKTLCVKFPHKQDTMVEFLASSLREEGGLKYKKALVNALLECIAKIPAAKEPGLDHFCEYIEDCEFPELAVQILNELATRGSKTSNPGQYIRFIFNRVILEKASVRSAAVSSLARFGIECPSLTDSIIVLLKRCLKDDDDDVRDRSRFNLRLLEDIQAQRSQRAALQKSLFSPLSFTSSSLSKSLALYLANGDTSRPFNLQEHLLSDDKFADQKSDSKTGGDSLGVAASAVANPGVSLFSSIPELAELGPIFTSSPHLELTEAEAEYGVSCVKHVMDEHIVFQFSVTNNMENQMICDVQVELEGDSDEWTPEFSIPEQQIKEQETGQCFVVVPRPSASDFQATSFQATLKFLTKDVDASTGEVDEDDEGEPDDYPLEDVEVVETELMRRGPSIGMIEFKRRWQAVGAQGECMKKFSLGLETVQAAVDYVISTFGMTACENTGIVNEGAPQHSIVLTGEYFDGVDVLVRGVFKQNPKGVTFKVAVRSPSEDRNALVASAIR